MKNTPKIKGPSEAMILKACRDFLDYHKIFYFRVNTTGVYDPRFGGFRRFQGTRGVSDLIAVIPQGGRICCIETKSESGVESKPQKEFSEKVVSLGGISLIVHSCEELERDLKSLEII